MIEKYFKKSFWRDLLNKEEILDPFPDSTILNNTIFMNVVYVNSNNNDIIDEWLIFPNRSALLGYFEYIWFPITFLSLTNVENQLVVPEIIDTQSVVNILRNSKNILNKELIENMENVNEQLTNIIYKNIEEDFEDIYEMQEYYKNSFCKEIDKFSSFTVFECPYMLGKYLLDKLGSEEILKISGLSNKEYLDLCSNVSQNNEKFLNIVNKALEML